jgi:DNA-binding NarL/FixJ family response regulator
MIRVLIVHPTPLFREGLRQVLGRVEDIQIIGEAVTAEQAVTLAQAAHPDLVLLASRLPTGNTVELASQLRLIGVGGIFVLSVSPDEEELFRFLMSGAAAYERAALSGGDLVEKIRCVARGEYIISSAVLRPQPPSEKAPIVQRKPPYDPTQVTPRELDVLKQIMTGRSNKQAARVLKLSDQTVKNYITSICRKFKANDRTHAVVIALRRGLIALEDVKAGDLVLSEEAFAQRRPHLITVRRAARQKASSLRKVAVNA